MQSHELVQLRARYDRQTAAWNALRERFASLPQEKLRVAHDLLEEVSACVTAVATVRPMGGTRA